MNDLVAELRASIGFRDGAYYPDLCQRAAAEIERLTAAASERDEWKAAAQEACDENNALRAERDRLRVALENIGKGPIAGAVAERIAREALAGGEK